ncbi:MAG TPA: hypothetical protein VGM88_13500 [Kofleriaceae bacterium]|jgi:hypothetical protein
MNNSDAWYPAGRDAFIPLGGLAASRSAALARTVAGHTTPASAPRRARRADAIGWAAALASLVAAGCVIQSADAEPAPAPKAAAPAVFASEPGRDVDLGSDADRTCFLLGVHGAMVASSEAGVVREGGHWKLRAHGDAVGATATCVATIANRVELSVTSDDVGTSVVASPGRRCFLTRIYATSDAWTTGLTEFPFGAPGVRVEPTGSAYVLRAWLHKTPGAKPTGGASAVCVDLPAAAAADVHVQPDAEAHLPDEADWTCGVAGVFGVFSQAEASNAALSIDRTGWHAAIGASAELYASCVR